MNDSDRNAVSLNELEAKVGTIEQRLTAWLPQLEQLSQTVTSSRARIDAIEQAATDHAGDAPWTGADLDALLNRVNALEVDLQKRALLWVEDTVRRHERNYDDILAKLDEIRTSVFIVDIVRHGNRLDGLYDLAQRAASRFDLLERDVARWTELESVVRRLDSDMALVRDAACPPQGAPFRVGVAPGTTCEWPGCTAQAICASGNYGGRLVCDEHFRCTNGISGLGGVALPGAQSGQEHPAGFLDWWNSQLVPGTHAAYLEVGSLRLAADGMITIRNLCERAWRCAIEWWVEAALREEVRKRSPVMPVPADPTTPDDRWPEGFNDWWFNWSAHVEPANYDETREFSARIWKAAIAWRARFAEVLDEVSLTREFDAAVWAREFCRIARGLGHILDEGWMLGWFANAIMAGWDTGRARLLEEQHPLIRVDGGPDGTVLPDQSIDEPV